MPIPSGYTSAQIVQAVPTGINSALVLITTQTIGTAVSSVPVTGVFSSTYDNYKIVISGGTASVNDENCGITLGSTTTGYYAGYIGTVFSGSATSGIGSNNASSWTRIVGLMTNGLNANFELNGPNLAKRTFITGFHVQDTVARSYGGYLDNTTQYTGFTITPASGTLTGGTVRVYGYTNS